MAFRLLRGRGKAPEVELAGGTYNAGLSRVQSLVPTADGSGTGTIQNPASVAVDIAGTVTSAGVNDIVVLPAPVVNTVVKLLNNATGYELRTTDPATIAINGGVGAAAESAIAASSYVECRCASTTAWICTNYSTAGVVTATQVAAP